MTQLFKIILLPEQWEDVREEPLTPRSNDAADLKPSQAWNAVTLPSPVTEEFSSIQFNQYVLAAERREYTSGQGP